MFLWPFVLFNSVAFCTAQTNLKKLLVLQKRALRLIHFANNRDHAVPFFKNTNNLPINMLYVETVSELMYDILVIIQHLEI